MAAPVRRLGLENPIPSEPGAVIVSERAGRREVTVVTEAGPCLVFVSDLTLGNDFERAVALAAELADAIGAPAVYARRDTAGEQAAAPERQRISA